MTGIGFVWFLANLILAAALIRTVEYTWPDSVFGRALGVIF